jgi:hypothetical protein
VSEFLRKKGADLNRLSEDGKTMIGEYILLEAIRDSQLSLVRILIEAGVPPNNPDQLLDRVLNATANGQTYVLNALLKLGGWEINPMDNSFADDFKSGKYPMASQLLSQKHCYWLGRY